MVLWSESKLYIKFCLPCYFSLLAAATAEVSQVIFDFNKLTITVGFALQPSCDFSYGFIYLVLGRAAAGLKHGLIYLPVVKSLKPSS